VVPVAPFSLINLAAGAFRIPVLDYSIGTALGLAPGLGLMSLLGDNLIDLVRTPTLSGIAIVVGVLVAAIGLSIGLQALVTRRRGPRRRYVRGSSGTAG
jgi:phospholipase D1/2